MSSFPLHLEPAEAFVQVRSFLRAAGFDDANLCRALRIENMSDLGKVDWDAPGAAGLPPVLRTCVDLLIRGHRLEAETVQAACGTAVFDALSALGLIRPARHEPTRVVCPVWVYPVDGFIVASDRRNDPDDDPFDPGSDIVFPAIYGGTLRFLELLPEARGADVLDMCGGTGIGAFHLARTAARAATSDLTERSALFAEFNARLNGLAVESLRGDLFAPVAGRTFDLVTAHPPFVPAIGGTMIYRDAGEAGEDVTRRIVQEVPPFLRPGGRLFMVCLGRDTTKAPFEARVAEWLGASRGEFDVVYALEKVMTVEEIVAGLQRRDTGLSGAQGEELARRLKSLETRQFVYGALLLERCREPNRLPPLRMGMTTSALAADLERVVGWRRERRRAGFEARLARSRPRLAPVLELTARYEVKEGSLVPVEFIYSAEAAFRTGLRIDGWMVPLVARLVGRETLEDVLRGAVAAGETPADFTLAAFVDLVAGMIEKGFLEVDRSE